MNSLILCLSLCLGQPQPSQVLQSSGVLRHASHVTSIAVSPDSKRLVAGLDNGQVLAFNLPSGKPVAVPFRTYSKIESLTFTPDGKTLAVATAGRGLHLLDGRRLKRSRSIRTKSSFNRIAFSPRGNVLFAAQRDGRLLRIAFPKVAITHREFPHQESLVLGLSVSPDGASLVHADRDGWIHLRKTADLSLKKKWRAQQKPILSLAFDARGRRLAAVGADRSVQVWSLSRFKRLAEKTGIHTEDVWAVTFDQNGDLYTAGQDGLLQCWRGKSLAAAESLTDYRGFIRAVALSPDGKWLIRGGSMLDIVSLRTPRDYVQLRQFGGSIVALDAHSNGKQWVTASLDKTATVWSLDSELEARTLRFDDWVTAACIQPDSETVAVGLANGRLQVFSLDTRKTIAKRRPHRDEITCLTAIAAKKRLISGSRDGRVAIMDETGAVQMEIAAGGPVRSLAVSPAGRWLAVAAGGDTIAIYDLKSGKQQMQLSGWPFSVTSLAVSPDGSRLACGYSDGSLRLLNTSNWKQTTFRHGNGDRVLSLVFGNQGKRLTIGRNTGSVQVFQVAGLSLIAERQAGLETWGVRFLTADLLVAAGGDHACRLYRLLDDKAKSNKVLPAKATASRGP